MLIEYYFGAAYHYIRKKNFHEPRNRLSTLSLLTSSVVLTAHCPLVDGGRTDDGNQTFLL